MRSDQPTQPQQNTARVRNSSASHRCNHCEVIFSRPEHLRRHQTMHSKLKAFSCPFCGKHFARSDVLRRHCQSCKSAQNSDKASAELSRRVNRACRSCRHSKVKCSGVQPCERCCSIGQSQQCHFIFRKARRASTSETSTMTPSAVPPIEGHALSQDSLAQDHQLENGPEDASAPTMDHGAQNLSVAQETLGLSNCGPMDETINSIQEVRPDHTNMDAPMSTSVTYALSSETTDIDFLSLGADAYFDLDLLDWGILDNSFVAQRDDDGTDTSWSESSIQQFDSPEATSTSPCEVNARGQRGITGFDLPTGISLMQISPLEAHRSRILQFLKDSNQGARRWDQWLSIDNITLFLHSYFRSFHQHTPLLHLPCWNISLTSTSLIFAMTLMGAIYSGGLETNGSEARKLCEAAQAFAWTSDSRLQAGGPAQLDTIQAVYIVTLLEAFYLPTKSYRPPVDTKRLVNEARNAGVFDTIPRDSESWKMKWDEWSAQECRTRTAFILYLFDAIRAILFNQRPELRAYELRFSLPCDENVFAAGTENEWRALCTNAQNVTRVDYPTILSLFLCRQPIDVPLHFSVMGGFIVLHGILLHMWEQKLLHSQKDHPEAVDAVEHRIREHLTDINSKVVDNALRLWRIHWARTMARPGSIASKGLYRDRALAYWLLGNTMNRNRSLAGGTVTPVLTSGNWTLKVPRLLRRLTVMMDSGQLDVLTENADSAQEESLDRHLGNFQENPVEGTEAEGMDTIILGCMMRRDRQSGH